MGIEDTRGEERTSVVIHAQYEMHESMKEMVPYGSQKYTSTLMDISPSGCALVAQIFVPKNVLVVVEIDGKPFYPGHAEKVIRAVGRVVNCRNLSRDSYRLSLLFTEIQGGDKEAIRLFVAENERRKEPRINLGPQGEASQ